MTAGDIKPAVTALQSAVDGALPNSDRLQALQQLGRMHSRSQNHQEAMKVWARVEREYPDDRNALEEVARTLLEEQEYAEAEKRFSKLAKYRHKLIAL